jgi:hypothetical protein
LNNKIETIRGFQSQDVVGYFETLRSAFYTKMATILLFEEGNLRHHKELSVAASTIAREMGDQFQSRALSKITPEVVENLKDDAVTGIVLDSWSVFELIIKDVVSPDYFLRTDLLQADFKRSVFGFTPTEQSEIGLFYHIRNAAMHYNGAYHTYRTVDIHYQGQHFLSAGHEGEKIVISPKLALQIATDLEKYSAQAWSKVAQTTGRS